MGDWMINVYGVYFKIKRKLTLSSTKTFEERDWHFDEAKTEPIADYQSMILHVMGNEGTEKCDEPSNPGCTGVGLEYRLCTSHPRAHFLWFAITHLARFLGKMSDTFVDSTVHVGLSTSALVHQFYVPREDPSRLIQPLGIAGGIAAALTLKVPQAAIGAGVGAIAAAALTGAALTKPE